MDKLQAMATFVQIVDRGSLTRAAEALGSSLPAVVRTLHDAFRKTLEDPAVLATFDKYDQTVIYMNTEDYTKFARETSGLCPASASLVAIPQSAK